MIILTIVNGEFKLKLQQYNAGPVNIMYRLIIGYNDYNFPDAELN